MLGDTNYNNNNNENTGTYYSQYVFRSQDSNQPTRFSASYWNNLLKISIAPAMEKTSNDEYQKFDNKLAVSAYLSHMKARILYNEICEFQKDPSAYKNVGIVAGATSMISLSNGEEFGKPDTLCIVVRKIDRDTAETTQLLPYFFESENHFGVRNYTVNNGTVEYDRSSYSDLELEAIKTLLKTYYEAMTGAVAASVMFFKERADKSLNTNISKICASLGIETRPQVGGSYNGGGNSFFNNSGNATQEFSQATLDMISGFQG